MKGISRFSPRRRICHALLVVTLMMGWILPVAAQSIVGAQLNIKVTDATGALIPDAEIVLTRENDERKLTTGVGGAAEASGLSPGEWTMTVRREGFQSRQRPVVIGERLVNVAVMLEIAPVNQTVVVEGQKDVASALRLDGAATGGAYLDMSIRELPFNLTVITQDLMQERGVTSMLEATELAPGVTTWADTGYIPAIDVRGLSTTDAGIYVAREGIVQNAVPQSGRPVDSFLLESVEVLKGPSSFMYGQGTAGAAVNSRTKEPKRQFGVDTLFAYESFGRTRLGLGVNVPITKELAARLDVSRSNGGTFVQRTDSTLRSMNGAVLWTPTSRVLLKAKGIYSDDDVSPYFSTPLLRAPIDPNVEYIKVAADSYLDPRSRSLNYNTIDGTNQAVNNFGTLTAEVLLPMGFQLKNTFYGATQRFSSRNSENISFNQTTLRVAPSGYFYARRRDVQVGNQLELRNSLRVLNRGVSFTIGGRVDDNEQHRFTGAPGLDTPPSMDYLTPVEYSPVHGNFAPLRDVNTKNYNGFFEGMARVTEKLTLTGGVRYDHIRNHRFDFANSATSFISYHAVTGRYALTYAILPNVNVYVGNSKAIQPAGSTNSTGSTALVSLAANQAQFSLQPSRGWEGGVKGSAWRNRIEGTLSYFQMRKHNILTTEVVDNVAITEQIGKIKSEGMEFSFVARPIRVFTLQGDFVWNNAEYLVFNQTVSGAVVSRAGNDLPRTPAVTWNVTPTLRINRFTAQLSFRTVGARWSDTANTLRLNPYTTLNANISIALPKGTRLTLTGKNLTDEIVIARGVQAGATTARISAPRNYSMQLTRSF
ncbi:MAG TPA: TonB-dependent receptor [Terriglobia bacterium]|nr:TonB-dependent receptor [Terriglobia bacterium]